MMRSFAGATLLQGILCLAGTHCLAQKKLINDTSYKDWSWLHQEYHLSNDGRYVSYDVQAYQATDQYGVLVTSKGEELMRTTNRIRCQFSADSRYLVSGLSSDSILVYDLVKRKASLATRGSGFQLLRAGKNNWIAYRMGNNVMVSNLETGHSTAYPAVIEYIPAEGTAALVLRKQEELIWLNLRKNTARTVFRGSTRFLTASREGNRFAFFHKEKDSAAIYHFAPSMTMAGLAAFNNMEGLGAQYFIDEQAPQFSDDGDQLYFTLRRKNAPKTKDADLLTDQVEVWHYRQPNLYASQRWHGPDLIRYKAVIGLAAPGFRPVQLEDDSLVMIGRPGNNYVLVKTKGREEEEYFNERQAPLYLLISLIDGSRKPFRERSSRLWSPLLSESEKFITWVNKDDQDLYAYEIATGITRNVSAGISIKPDITLNNYGSPSMKINFFPDAWYGQDDWLLIHDRYDCWLIDPLAVKPPINITNGYGRENRIAFRPATGERMEKLPGGTLILRARDERTGDNGFWQTVVDWSNPSQKIMEPCIYSWHKMGELPRLYKAKNAEVYIVTRQTAAQSPNLFISTDLRTFRQISFIQPEKEYNWMSSELLRFRRKDGDTGQAILYKPGNFDPAKKYPVIFHFYQERNSELHDYRRPGIEPNQVDIPWYVSNGYLVCIPDIIHTKPGHIAETVVNSVEGAARYLCGFPWVDPTRLGAQGHSFGGYETLLLIAHSRLFAAAQASAAVSDLVSAIGGMAFGDHELYTWHETGQANMGIGNLPWSNPQSYIDNSPIFHTDKINTPLLLMHGYEDENVKFGQDIEMFTALRRLQKPVWILGYKDGHILADHNEIGKDAALRQRQFFEYYLKGKRAPLWMTKGVDPEDRSFRSGLQLDASGAKP